MSALPTPGTGPEAGSLYGSLFDTSGDGVRNASVWEGGGEVGGRDLGWQVVPEAQAPQEEQPAPGAAADDGLRCLDPSHEKQCVRCRAAPGREALDLYKLHSLSGPRAGEQRLRHLILSCPEWNDTHARLALAQQLDDEGDGDTARVLRAKDAPSLRKPSMCAIARGWKYKADVFRPKSERLEHFVPPSSRRSKRQRTAPSTYAEGASEEALDAVLDRDGAQGQGGPGHGHLAAAYGHSMHAAGLQLHHSLAAHAAHNALLSSMQGFHDMPPLGLAATAGANAAMQHIQPYGTPFALPLWQAAAASIGLHPSSFMTATGGMGQQGQGQLQGGQHQQGAHMAALDAAAAALFSLPPNGAGGLNGLGLAQPTWRLQLPPMAGQQQQQQQQVGPPPQGLMLPGATSLAGLLGVPELGDDKE